MNKDKNNIPQTLALIDESEEVKLLLLEGFSAYSKFNSINTGYDSIVSPIALGVEKLSKLIISVDEHVQNGVISTNFRVFSHNLIKLKDRISLIYDRSHCRSKNVDEAFVRHDELLHRVLFLLKEYLFFGKFDTLNQLENPGSESVKSAWIELEDSFFDYQNSSIPQHHHKSHAVLGTIEKYVRALVRLPYFDCMDGEAKMILSPLMPFLTISDDELGLRDYESLLANEIGNIPNPVRTCSESCFWSKYGKVHTRKTIRQSNYEGSWPFVVDEVVLECRDTNSALIVIEGEYYRLNGRSGARYNLSCPFSAGLAIVGISILPFIDQALELQPIADFLKR